MRKKSWKWKLQKSHKQHKGICCDSDQTNERSVWRELQVSEERNRIRPQKMERYPMLTDWQYQYSKNGQLSESNLQIHYNPHQSPKSFFIQLERVILKFIWNSKKPRIAKNILNKKGISVGISFPDLKQ